VRLRRAAGVALALGALLPAAAPALERLPAALHVHSDLTTGDHSLAALAAAAERQGIEALLLAENYLLRVEYGVPPFRALTRVTWEEPSVLAAGVDRYLARVAEARRRHPRVLLVPGVEVMPHYYWTRERFALHLTVHDTQKNLLVFGVTDPAALAALPVAGNRRAGLTWQSALEAIPALLVVAGVGVLARKHGRRRRLGRLMVGVRRRRRVIGAALVAIGAAALVRGWPFLQDPYPPWAPAGLAPHQALIDRVEGLGGAAVWSFPEAPDAGERRFGPVRVTWRTEPHADDLLRTFRYTAFGALYEQPTRVTEPGGVWDRLLAQYAAGERSRPAWAVGESGFHDTSAGKRLGAVQTVLLVSERSEAGVLQALRRGRLYALKRTPDSALVLAEFAVTGGAGTAGPGDTLAVPAGARIELRLAIEATAGAEPVRVILVRNGVAAEAWAGRTPFHATYRETYDGAPLVLRVDVRGRAPHHLVASPVFVQAPR